MKLFEKLRKIVLLKKKLFVNNLFLNSYFNNDHIILFQDLKLYLKKNILNT